MNCIDRNELELFLAGKLPVDRMLAVDEHISECADCRALAGRTGTVVQLAAEITGAADCPEYEELSAYVDESLDPAAARVVRLHANLCELCSRDIDRMQALRSHAALRDKVSVQPRSSRRQAHRSFFYYWKELVAVGSVAALAGLAIMHNIAGPVAKAPHQVVVNPPITQVGPTTRPTVPPKPDVSVARKPDVEPAPAARTPQQPASNVASAPAALLKDGRYSVIKKGGALVFARANGAPASTSLDARIAAGIDEKLRSGKLAAPKLITAVMTPIAVRDDGTGYSAPPSAPQPIKPIDKIVLEARPAFHWSAVDLAKSYRVRVYDAEGNLVAEQTTSGTHLTLTQPLDRGKAYCWRVGARFGETDQWMQSELSSLGVLSADDYASIQRVRAAMPGSHLAMGVAYESAGLYEQARDEYRALRRANPNSKLAQKLLHGAAGR